MCQDSVSTGRPQDPFASHIHSILTLSWLKWVDWQDPDPVLKASLRKAHWYHDALS